MFWIWLSIGVVSGLEATINCGNNEVHENFFLGMFLIALIGMESCSM